MAGSSIMSKTLGGAGFLVGNVIMPGMTYKQSREEGRSVGASLARTALDEIFYSTKIGGYVGFAQMGVAGAQMLMESGRQNASYQEGFYKGQFGGNFNLSENGHTMRQRGTNAIQRTGMNMQNALGGEAKTYHRGYYSE